MPIVYPALGVIIMNRKTRRFATALFTIFSLIFQSLAPAVIFASELTSSVPAEVVTSLSEVTELPTPTDALIPISTPEIMAVPTSGEMPPLTPTPVLEPTVTATPIPTLRVENLLLAETPTPIPTEEIIISGLSEKPSAVPSEIPISTPIFSSWSFEKVELNKEYAFPQNSAVKLIFTKLPNSSGNIKIEEISLTKEQIAQTGSLSDKAYNITSDMKDGEFTYNLSLPIPESSKGITVEVKFSETISDIGTAEKVENALTKTDVSLSVANLDHFTIFVVVGIVEEDNSVIQFDENSAGIVINEFLYDPSSGNEWVELFNRTEEDTNLNGWKLEDGNSVNDDISLEGVIPAFGLLVFENGDSWLNNTSSNGSGDTLTLKNGDTVIDQVTYQKEPADTLVNAQDVGNIAEGQSIGRVTDGSSADGWQVYTSPSKGWLNDAGEPEKAPLLLAIDNALSGQGIDSNIGELDNPTNTPSGDNGLYFEKVGQGKILFTTNLNLTSQATVSVLQSLGEKMEMTDGHIKFDSQTANDMAATGAKLFMYGLNDLGYSSTPNVAVRDDDGNEITNEDIDNYPITGEIEYYQDLNNGQIIFSASHFTQFDVENLNIYVDGSADSEGADGTQDYPYTTIQEGIDAAPENGTVNIAAGTYISNKKITISTNGLHLVGPGIAEDIERAIIQNTNCNKHTIAVLATDVHIEGLQLEQRDGDGNYCLNSGQPVVRLNSPATNTVITNNDIAGGENGILFPYDTLVGTASNNLIHDNAHGIVVNSPNTHIENNEIYNSSGTDVTVGFGIWFRCLSSQPCDSSGSLVEGNNLHNNNYAVNLQSGVLSDQISIHNNTISGNDDGIFNDSGNSELDVTNNWWGDASGPSGESLGLGDSVSLNIDFNPWYTDVEMTTLASSTKAITSFNFTDPSVAGTVDEITHNITLTVPNGTDITFLTPTIEFSSQASVSPEPDTAQDFTNPVTYTVIAEDYSIQDYTVTVIVVSPTQTVPNSDGSATLDNDTPQVVVVSPSQPVTVTIGSGTTDPSIDYSSLISEGTGTIPQTTIDSDTADIAIPATTMTGPADWNGVVAAPTVTTVTLPETSGETSTLGTAIEIGFADDKLSFGNGVRILLPNQAGKKAGYSRPGTAFTEITSVCAADSQETGDALEAEGDCKIDVGLDLVIWTKHFTKFASYTKTTNSTSTSSSTSSQGETANVSAPICGDTKPANAPTLLLATAGLNSVTLTWVAAGNPLTYYLVTYGASSGAQTYGNPNIGGSGTTSYTVNGLSGGVRYYFRVRGGNGCMPGDYSNELSVTPFGGFVSGPALDFSEGVLGAETAIYPEIFTPIPSVISVLSPAPTPGKVLGQKSGSFNWRWLLLFSPLLLLLLWWRSLHKKNPE